MPRAAPRAAPDSAREGVSIRAGIQRPVEPVATSSATAVPISGFLGRRHEPVAIIGADGILGSALATVLSQCGVPRVALSRGDCDVSRSGDLIWLLNDVAPACVINCAAVTAADLCRADNELATEVNGMAVGRLTALCRWHRTPLVHVSCAAVFDGTSNRPYQVGDDPNPASGYGRTKSLGEALLRRFAPERWMLVRTSWLFGAIGRDCVGRLLATVDAAGGQPIVVADDQVGSPTFSADLARAILLLLIAGSTGVWHLSNGGRVSSHGFAQTILRIWGRSGRVRSSLQDACGKDESEPPVVRSSVLDCSDTYRMLGLQMRGWEAALQSYYFSLERHVSAEARPATEAPAVRELRPAT
jgi:dTDP-4-dehydrorhamnose reductase